MSINDLITQITDLGGFQYSTKFEVKFSVNCIFGSNSSLQLKPTDFEDGNGNNKFLPPVYVSMNGRTVELISDQMSGPGSGRTVPINPSFESKSGLLMKFPIDKNWTIYKLLNKWIRTLANDGSNLDQNALTSANFYDDCARNGQIIVKGLSYNGNPNCTIIFYEAFPVVITPVDFKAEPNNGISMFDVIFAYRNFRVTGET